MRGSFIALLLASTAACSSLGIGSVPDGGGPGDGGKGSDATSHRDGTTEGGAAPCACLADGMFCGADGACVPCSTSSQCKGLDAGTPACQLENPDSSVYGHCVACTAESPCPNGQVCDVLGIDNPTGMPSTRTPNLCYPDCRKNSGECAPGVSFCSPDSGLCGFGCLTTANACAPVGEFCNSDAGVCVACRSSADCPINNPGCFNGNCGSCAQRTDCPLGQACDTVSGICHCTSSSECTLPAPTSNVNLGKTLDAAIDLGCGCINDAGACPSGTMCNPRLGANLGGECLPSCVHDGGPNCAAEGLVCRPDGGLCGACTKSTECIANPRGLVCALDGGSTGSCVCTVGNSATCSSGMVCNPPNGCTRSCTTVDGGCAVSGGVCDPATGACRGCVKASDCAKSTTGTLCDNGDGGTFTCICRSPANCLAPEAGCSTQLERCGLCDSPADCPTTNPGCNSSTATCGSCTATTDCPSAVPKCGDAGVCGN